MSFATQNWFFSPDTNPEIESETESRLELSAAHRARTAAERETIRHRLIVEEDFEMAAKLADCGTPVPLVCLCCGHDKIVEMRCKRRWCPACAYSVQRARMERFEGAVALMQWPLFVTLTARNSGDPECIRELRANWSRFRRRKIIADRMTGGVVALEVTNTGRGWHPHLHCIVDCQWLSLHIPAPLRSDSKGVIKQKCEMAQNELSHRWAESIGQDEAVVWVRRVAGVEALKYSLKYSVKGTELAECDEAISPLVRVMEKTRLVSAFGNLHGRTSEMIDDEQPVAECTECHNSKTFMPLDLVQNMIRRDPGAVMPIACFKPGSPGWMGGHTG